MKKEGNEGLAVIEEVDEVEESEPEYADVLEIDLWQLMQEMEADPHAIDRMFQQPEGQADAEGLIINAIL